VLKLEPEILQ
jgi:hypothetical protein